jgi:NAD(P)-dependent dehydrogenase (short-subunit alcohol dehydrogenase family)
MNIVILGATRGMGRALARAAAARGDTLFLLGRSPDDLARSAADLGARSGRPAPGLAVCDLEAPATFGPALDAAFAALGKVDAVVVTAGLFATQDALEADRALAARVLAVNYTNTVLFCEEARVRLLAAGGGTLCAFSSVAGDRGRKPVGLYGSSKAGLSHYLESLDHRFRAAGLVTLCVKPGFVKTGMTEGLKPPPFAGEPDAVAAEVLAALDARAPLLYTPGIWRLVMLVIRHLPRAVMRKVAF